MHVNGMLHRIAACLTCPSCLWPICRLPPGCPSLLRASRPLHRTTHPKIGVSRRSSNTGRGVVPLDTRMRVQCTMHAWQDTREWYVVRLQMEPSKPALHHCNPPPLRTSPLPAPSIFAPPPPPPPAPPLRGIRPPPPPPPRGVQQLCGRLGVHFCEGFAIRGGVWPNMGQNRKNFRGGADRVVRAFDHILNVESAEVQRRMPKLP